MARGDFRRLRALPRPPPRKAAFLTKLGLPGASRRDRAGPFAGAPFPASLALAAMAVGTARLFPPLEAAEAPMTKPLRQALVTSWGHWRGEALALVTPA